MTVMLERLRQLDAARKRGDLTDAQYADARSKLLSMVEDAEVEPAGPRARGATAAKAARPRPRPAAASSARRAAPMVAPQSDPTESHDMSFFWGLILVGLCAVVGGVFTVAGMVDAFLHRTLKWVAPSAVEK